MTDLSEFEHAEPEHHQRVQPRHPSGWEPGVVWDGDSGTVTTHPTDARPTSWDDVLKIWDLDPAVFRVVEPVQFRAWDSAIGGGQVKRLYYWRATVVTRRPDGVDLAELAADVMRRKPSKRERPTGARSLVVCYADWQIGKRDGDGLEGTVGRVIDSIGLVQDRLRDLRRLKIDVGQLTLLTLGDMHEGCTGHYPMQEFSVEADRRTQGRITRRLLTKVVTELAPKADRVLVAGVGGNHGENRKDGKAFTSFGDNDDVAVLEQVAEVVGANPDAFGHVGFVIPDQRLSLALDVCGTTVGLIHGHQARKGGSPQQKIWRWWEQQAHAGTPVGMADVLVSGHYHHLLVTQEGGRTHFQCPALDGGSTWWQEQGGHPTRAGTLTFVTGPEGWSHMEVL